MKTNKKSIIFIMLVLFVIIVTPIYSKAVILTQKDFTEYTIKIGDAITSPDSYAMGHNPITSDDTSVIVEKINKIIGIIVTVGVVASVAVLAILGIKYMIGSVEEKAEYKKSMIPYIIGSILLFSSSTIVGIIAELLKIAIN